MNLLTMLNDQVALLNDGKPLETFDRYFDDDGVMLDNDQPFGFRNRSTFVDGEPLPSPSTQ
jgi:hypothetical protein